MSANPTENQKLQNLAEILIKKLGPLGSLRMINAVLKLMEATGQLDHLKIDCDLYALMLTLDGVVLASGDQITVTHTRRPGISVLVRAVEDPRLAETITDDDIPY